MKGYTVFNVEQISGLPRIAHAESSLPPCGPRYAMTARAYYSVSTNHAQMPSYETFPDAESYYATLAHELTRWTKHPSRLDRDFGRKRWADEGYAAEELIAKLGAAFICAALDLTPEVREDHASYFASWLKVKNDKRTIFTAASHAQRAADYLNRLQAPAQAEAA